VSALAAPDQASNPAARFTPLGRVAAAWIAWTILTARRVSSP
jgi:hypothetical protein